MKSTDLLLRSAIQMKLDIIQITIINWPMRTALIVILINIATQAGAECGKLCDHYWRKTATKADVKAELGGGADIMAWNRIGGRTPLHFCFFVWQPCKYSSPANRWCCRIGGSWERLYIAAFCRCVWDLCKISNPAVSRWRRQRAD